MELRVKLEYETIYLSSSFPIENGLKQGDALSPLLFNFPLEYAIMKVQKTNLGLDMNGTHQVLAYEDNVNLIGDDIRTIERNAGYWFSSKHRAN